MNQRFSKLASHNITTFLPMEDKNEILQQLETTNKSIDAINKSIDVINKTIASINIKVEDQADQTESLRKSLLNLHKIVEHGFKVIDTNFENVDKRIDALEKKVDALSEHSSNEFKAVGGKLNNIEAEVMKIQKVSNYNEEYENLLKISR